MPQRTNELFSQAIRQLHGGSLEDVRNIPKINSAIKSVNGGQVAVHKKGDRFESARDFWINNGVPKSEVNQVVDWKSEWILSEDIAELADKLLDDTTSLEEFTQYCLRVYQRLDNFIQPTLDATAHSSYGFNGHTNPTHQDGLRERLAQLNKEKSLSLQVSKLVVFAVTLHDNGCALGRSAHAINAIGVLYLMYGQELFSVPELQPALKAILFHDEPFIVPQIEQFIKDSAQMSLKNSEEDQVRVLFELLENFGSQAMFLLLLLDKSDGRRERVGNTRTDQLDPEGLWEDKHFLANIPWKIGLFDLHTREDGSSVFKLGYEFNLEPDDKIVTPDSKLVHKPKDQYRKPEIRMPADLHELFKLQNKERGYFEFISDLFVNLYGERLSLVALSAFAAFPDIQEVEIILSDPVVYEPKIGESRVRKSNPDIRYVFRKNKLISAKKAITESVKNNRTAREIANTLQMINEGTVYVPIAKDKS